MNWTNIALAATAWIATGFVAVSFINVALGDSIWERRGELAMKTTVVLFWPIALAVTHRDWDERYRLPSLGLWFESHIRTFLEDRDGQG